MKMLDLRVEIKNDRVVMQGLEKLAREFPGAVKRGLKNIGRGVYQQAFQWLSGPGAKKSNIPGGGYPVPVRTGHLRGRLDWLDPGQSKSGEAGTFTAGDMETVVFDSASYAGDIFSGSGSSGPYGERDALRDGLDVFDRTRGVVFTIDLEIRKEINRHA
jgi:hypothetical protein